MSRELQEWMNQSINRTGISLFLAGIRRETPSRNIPFPYDSTECWYVSHSTQKFPIVSWQTIWNHSRKKNYQECSFLSKLLLLLFIICGVLTLFRELACHRGSIKKLLLRKWQIANFKYTSTDVQYSTSLEASRELLACHSCSTVHWKTSAKMTDRQFQIYYTRTGLHFLFFSRL